MMVEMLDVRPVPLMRPDLPTAEKIMPYLNAIDDNRRYTNFGPLVSRFETELATHFDAPSAGVVTTCNGTLGLAAALMETAKPGRRYCLLPGWSFIACACAAQLAGLEICLADVDPESWALDMDAASTMVRRIGDDIAAVLLVSPFGAALNVADWHDWSRSEGIPVVIDAATGFDSARAGPLPTVISFHATKAFGIGISSPIPVAGEV